MTESHAPDRVAGRPRGPAVPRRRDRPARARSPTARSRPSSGSPRTPSWRRRSRTRSPICAMATAEFGHLGQAARPPRRAGRRPVRGDGAVPRALDAFHAHTAPRDWYEGLIKAYVGDGLAADFYREIAAYLDADTRDLIIASLEPTPATPTSWSSGCAARIASRPPARRTARAVGPPADGRGADPGAAGGGRARRPHRAARRRGRPARPRPGRARPDVHPAHRSCTPHRMAELGLEA